MTNVTRQPNDPKQTGQRTVLRNIIVGSSVICVIGVGVMIWRQHALTSAYENGLVGILTGDMALIERSARLLPVDSARAKLLLAAIDLHNNQPAVALKKLRIAARDPATAGPAQFLVGEGLCRLQEYPAAIAILKGALEREPDRADAHRWLAVANFDLGATAEAILQLKEVIRLDPTDPRAHRMLGLIYFEAEEFPQAIGEYQASLACSPNQVDRERILFELASAQLRLHQYEDVLELLNVEQTSLELESIRAEALYGAGRFAEARAAAVRIRQASPLPRALILYAMLLLDEGKPAEAVLPLKQAAELDPGDFEIRAKLTQAYSLAGDAALARAELAEFERLKLIRQQIHDLGLKAANQPDNAELRYQIGLCYKQLGRIELAQKWFRAAVSLDPAHNAARIELTHPQPITATSDRN